MKIKKKKIKRLDKRNRQYGVHMSHCNTGENIGLCKYGENNICPALKDDRKIDNRMDDEIGFIEGLWFAIEQLVINHDEPDYAKFIIQESNLPEWEFRNNLKQTQYKVEILSEFLDKVFNEE